MELNRLYRYRPLARREVVIRIYGYKIEDLPSQYWSRACLNWVIVIQAESQFFSHDDRLPYRLVSHN